MLIYGCYRLRNALLAVFIDPSEEKLEIEHNFVFLFLFVGCPGAEKLKIFGMAIFEHSVDGVAA